LYFWQKEPSTMQCQTCLENGFIGAIILMASLHGLLLAVMLLFSKKLRSKANRFLALALCGMCVILGYEAAAYLNVEDDIPLFIQFLPLYIRTTIPAGLFYFVIFLIQPDHTLKGLDWLGFFAILIEGIIDALYVPAYIMQDEAAAEQAIDFIDYLGEFWGIICALVLIPMALQRVNHYQQFLLDHYSTTNNKSLRWLRNFLVLVLVVVGIWAVSLFQCKMGYWEECEKSFFVVTMCLVILLFGVGYFVILHYSWFEIIPIKVDAAAPEQKLSTKTSRYHASLIELMQHEKLYQDIDLTLDKLASHLKISSGYLSQIINEKEGKNFFEFVNNYRVSAVKEKLLDRKYAHYSIMGIASESGFKSKSTFNAVFKKFTGQTPSAFKRQNAV
jgi:AraC-like DNA-binding protein